MCNVPLSCVCCVLVRLRNPELAYNADVALFPADNMTFPCSEWVSVQQFFYFLGIGCVPARGVGGEGSPAPCTPPSPPTPTCSSKALPCVPASLCPGPLPASANEQEMDLPDDEETAEPVKVWVHTQALCQYGHWHGTRVSAELCSLCNSCADPGCGGGKWTLRRPPGPSSGKKKLKRFSRIVWRALINRRLHGSFENFTKGLPTEDAVVVSYDPEAKEWNEEPVLVKVETEPFGKGGMRQVWCPVTLHCVVACCVVLCHRVSSCAVLCRSVLCCAVLCCAVLCCVVLGLRCVVLCCVVLYCAEGAVTRRQWPGCLPTGTGKREGCV